MHPCFSFLCACVLKPITQRSVCSMDAEKKKEEKSPKRKYTSDNYWTEEDDRVVKCWDEGLHDGLIRLFLGAGLKKKKKVQAERCVSMCFIYFHDIAPSNKSVYTISLQDDVYFPTGYWRWPPRRPGRWPAPDGALVWERKEEKGGGGHYDGNRWQERERLFYNVPVSSPVQTVRGYKRWRPRRVALPGLGHDSAKNTQSEQSGRSVAVVSLPGAREARGTTFYNWRQGKGEQTTIHIF